MRSRQCTSGAATVSKSKGLAMEHAGTDLSFKLIVKSRQELGIIFPDGKRRSIRTVGKAPIKACCPSVEGTVIVVFFKDRTQDCYVVETGEIIDELFFEKVKNGLVRLPQITLYT